MSTLREILTKDIEREIEGVIKADDTRRVHEEIDEYVITGEIERQLSTLFEGLREAISVSKQPGSQIYPYNGVWISGYFGSGKSHLLKILAYLLDVEAEPAFRDVFLRKVQQSLLRADVERVFAVPARSILFNIDQQADATSEGDGAVVLRVFEKVFNRMLGYHDDNPIVAEFERDLDARGEYEQFKEHYRSCTGTTWEDGRRDVMFLDRDLFAKVLADFREMSVETAEQLLTRYEEQRTLSVEAFAKNVREWLHRQEDDQFRLNFFVDEVGQFVGNSPTRMLNLQTIAETLATVCENRCWVFVTSQEDLDQVIGDATQQQRNDFSRITARFYFRTALTSANVEEVIQKRLLPKNDTGKRELESFYDTERNSLRGLFQFGAGAKAIDFKDADHFVRSYPFVAYQYHLLQQSLRGLSDHNAFMGRHVSRGERSMLDVFQHVGKELADVPLVHFATFDRMFDGIRNTLKGGLIAQINTAEEQLSSQIATRVLKTLLMVKYTEREIRSTADNIALLLADTVTADVAELRADVQAALDELERQSYVQRVDDVYEYLTDDEKDVEIEIKNTQVEYFQQRKTIGEVVFDKVLRSTRITYEANGQDYAFGRLVDAETLGRATADLAIHVITHLHPNAENTNDVLNQSMGKKELLIVLDTDTRVAEDLRLYHQTDIYLRQRSGDDSTRQRILADKRVRNDERYRRLVDRDLPDTIAAARVFTYGDELTTGARDERERILAGFQELVRKAYPNLRLLAEKYSEERLWSILFPSDDEAVFASDALGMGEDEAEVDAFLRRQHGDAVNTTVSIAKEKFSGGQYGWHEWAILCVVAKLYMRNAVELVEGSRILGTEDVYNALRSSRGHDQIVVRPAVEFDPGTVNRLKRFHQDFFLKAAEKSSGNEVAVEIKKHLLEVRDEIKELLRDESRFPFLSALRDPLAEYDLLVNKDRHALVDGVLSNEADLLRQKTDVVDAISTFMNGPNRETFDSIRIFMRDNAENLPETDMEEEISVLTEYLETLAPYQNNATRSARKAYEAVQRRIAERLEKERRIACEEIERLIGTIRQFEEYESLTEDEKAEVLGPLHRLKEQEIPGQNLIPVIQQRAQVKGPELAQTARKMAAKKADPESEVVYATVSEKRLAYGKQYLSTPEDVDSYVVALKEHYLKLVRDGKRIPL